VTLRERSYQKMPPIFGFFVPTRGSKIPPCTHQRTSQALRRCSSHPSSMEQPTRFRNAGRALEAGHFGESQLCWIAIGGLSLVAPATNRLAIWLGTTEDSVQYCCARRRI